MKVKILYLAMWLLAVVPPFSSMGQSNNTAAGCDTSSIAVSARASTLDAQKLENGSDILKAASAVIRQMANKQADLPHETAADLIDGSESQVINPIVLGVLGADSLPNASKLIDDQKQAKQQCQTVSTTANVNKQSGASSGADGTTSMTDLTGIQDLLSIAVENGSVTNDINGTTMTLSTTPYGLLTGFHEIDDSSHNYDACGFCHLLAVSATFNVTDNSSPLTNATRKDISQWQLKYSIFDKSTRSQQIEKEWKKIVAPASQQLVNVFEPEINSDLYDSLKVALDGYVGSHNDDIMTCINRINTSQASATMCSFASNSLPPQPATYDGLAILILQGLDTYTKFQNELKQVPNIPALRAWSDSYKQARKGYDDALPKFEAEVDNLSKGFNIDLTFGQQFPTTTNSSSSAGTTSGQARPFQPVGMATAATSTSTIPDYLVGGLDLSWQPKTSNDGTTNKAPLPTEPGVTFNAKASMYPNPVAALNEKTFRGAQAALQFQWELGKGPFVSDPNDKNKVTIAFSGSYQRLTENKDQAGKRPDITSGNFKLTIPFPGGISFPLAVTFANSQQQAKGSYAIGNFGISFDADKLLALKH